MRAHFIGHLLGFADLYNESQTTTDLPYSLMGGWYYDTAASLLDPFSRVAIGWAIGDRYEAEIAQRRAEDAAYR